MTGCSAPTCCVYSNIFNVQKDASLNDKYVIIKTKHFCIFVLAQSMCRNVRSKPSSSWHDGLKR